MKSRRMNLTAQTYITSTASRTSKHSPALRMRVCLRITHTVHMCVRVSICVYVCMHVSVCAVCVCVCVCVCEYRSPVNMPPHFVHYIYPKVERAYILVSSIRAQKVFTQVLYRYTQTIMTLHVHITTQLVQRIESTVHGHHVCKAVWSPYIGEKAPSNVRAITFATT